MWFTSSNWAIMQQNESQIFVIVKDGSAVDRRSVTTGFKKFLLGCKNHDNQSSSCGPKTVYYRAVLYTIETNPANSTGRYQMSWVSRNPVWFISFITPTKAYKTVKLSSPLSKYIAKLLIHSSKSQRNVNGFKYHLKLQ